ncbi:helix-turn-helix domain-containing protein [Bilophila wadsworthia]|uniref:helix-turn-helix domain-containing protein n=1 Tax=Bilophila wadsworthia TaxID=35833 RepID=UPI001D2ADD32|nr:helix-turn-helix transcriptional regulator [Bilophila wadsworthia]MBS5375504.1 helix-turn-helix transcriptional regulator [Bilophila wadsworthia]
MDTLGKRIKLARGKVSQDAFSRSIQVSKGSLGFYERDENLPNSDTILKICSLTGVRIEWLLTGKGPMRDGENNIEGTATHESAITPSPSTPSAEWSLTKLERELELEKEERRELAVENRRLYREKEELLKELGELRATVARLEERKNRLAVANGVSSENSGAA